MGLSANRAIHISGIGDFLIDRIEKAQVPAELDAHTSHKGGDQAVRMEEDPAVLATPDTEAQDGLDRENQPNLLDAEQTWPTEEVGSLEKTPCLQDFKAYPPPTRVE